MKTVVSISLTMLFTAFAASAQAQESFRIELGRDGETIADMRPVFLEFQSRPMPAISPTEVARRYRTTRSVHDLNDMLEQEELKSLGDLIDIIAAPEAPTPLPQAQALPPLNPN